MHIDEKGHIHTLPQVIAKYTPPLHRLPELLYKLAVFVNWEEEQECFKTFAKQLAWFYSLCEDYEIEQAQSSDEAPDAESFNSKSNEQITNELASGYSVQMLKFITQHIFYPACKSKQFNPPVEFATNGTVIETACLAQLYKVFERC